MIMSICDNCGCEFDALDANTCEDCGATLCPECICEDCENMDKGGQNEAK